MDSKAFWGKPAGRAMRSRATGGRIAGITCSWTSSGSSSGAAGCWIREPDRPSTSPAVESASTRDGISPKGLNVELSIAWPVLLHNVAPMQLVATGKIVRCNGRQVAIQTTQHEFRTAGISAEQRNAQLGQSRTDHNPSDAVQFADARRVRQTLGQLHRQARNRRRGRPCVYLPRRPMTGSGTGGGGGGTSSSTIFFGLRFRISLMNSSRALAYFGVPGLASIVAHSSGVISWTVRQILLEVVAQPLLHRLQRRVVQHEQHVLRRGGSHDVVDVRGLADRAARATPLPVSWRGLRASATGPHPPWASRSP